MTCIRCQAVEAAIAAGNEPAVADYFRREVERLERIVDGRPEPEVVAEGDVIPRAEHERIVGRLNATIADLNARAS